MMLVLEDSALISLAQNAALVSEFPFLAQARQAGCRCSKPRADLNAVKAQVAALPEAGRQRFKQLAGHAEIKVIYREGSETRSQVF